tara:strand:+ start:1336 stop:1971 length:636 start_codon:yes stop_codon:yes gene_type:complete
MAFRIMRWLGVAALLIGYAFLAHHTNKTVHNGNLGALVAIAPIILVLFLSTKQSVWLLGSLTVVLSTVLWFGWTTLTQHFWLVYWLQDTGIQFILFIMFGRTLFAGRQPLCTRFAQMLHSEPLSENHVIYTRQITVAWTIFFALMTLTSTLLFLLTPLPTWSFFANFLTPPLIALMFILEYGVRIWVLPESRKTHILDAFRAYKNDSKRFP